MKNILKINLEDGSVATIDVLDIIDSKVYNKTFIIYTFEDEGKTIFASILNEDEDSYSLDTITEKEEIDFINREINRVASEK